MIAPPAPFPCLLCPDSRQEDSAQGSPFLEMLEKDSWVSEDDLKYAGEVVYLCVLNIWIEIRLQTEESRVQFQSRACTSVAGSSQAWALVGANGGGIKLRGVFLRKHLSYLSDH